MLERRDSKAPTDWVGYAFVAFFAVPFLIFNVVPVLFGVYVALHRMGHLRPAALWSGSRTTATRSTTTGCAWPS